MYDRLAMIKEISLDKEKVSPDLKRIQATYHDLTHDITHPSPCLCPSCLYQLHKKQGGKYSKEIFFLDWLQFEINISLREQLPKYVFESTFDKGALKNFIEGQDFMNLLSGRGSLVALSEFLEKGFPDIDHDYKRLKLRLWRFKKSEALKQLEREKIKEWMKAHPVKRHDHPMIKFRLLQKIADFVYSQPEHRVLQREIHRRFFQRKSANDVEEALDKMRPWLRLNYGIEYLEGKKQGLRKNQALYIGTMKSSRGRFFRIGAPMSGQ